MKIVLEVLLAIILHPIAFVLALIDIIGRKDLNDGQKIVWAIVCLLWGIGPILYFLVGGGTLW
jgi:hypothetical protein